ncbi:MAG TPA: PA domain-containing protein, partial [Acidimicrobiales bacterium]
RGTCGFVVKAANAQAAGATAMIVANNAPGAPITMGGTDPAITIPSVMVSQADGTTIKTGLPATGTVSSNPQPPVRSCHDTGVILGDAMLAGCAGGNGFSVWSLDPADGGSLEDPAILYSRSVPGVSIGHSASFSWDGEILVFGHEPGGGGQAQCQATTPEVNRTMFFFESRTGVELGRHVLPRPQTSTENCTIHNYNVVPTNKARVVVHGSYQSGIGVVDFTDPANATEIASADPAPLSETSLVLGGDWSTYWYDGFIYESDIRRGLLDWRLSDPAVAGARKLGHLNPQTQETTFALTG